jgi:Tol biopolymer transport system component
MVRSGYPRAVSRMKAIGRLGIVTALVLAGLTPGSSARAAGTHVRIIFGHTFRSGNVNIVSVLPDGTDLQRLTRRPAFDGCAAGSPNGARISWCSDATGALEVWTMHRDGSQTHVTSHFADWAADPDYRTGRSGHKGLAFAADVGNGHDIYRANTRGRDVIRVTHSPAADDFPAWSPDGSHIAFVSDRTGTPQVYVMTQGGHRVTQLTHDPNGVTEGPDWRPDGSRIVFAAGPPGAEDIFLMDPDGSHVTQLTTDPASDYAPAWSPNGRRIAFLSTRVPGSRNVFVMNANGNDQHSITPPGSVDFGPAWLPRR